MKSYQSKYWTQLHLVTRVYMLAQLVAILLWQSRYMWKVHDPMYGWPVPFNNLWYVGHDEWSPLILFFDLSIWLVIVGASGYVLEVHFRRKLLFQFSLSVFFSVQAILGVLFILRYLEIWLLSHSNNHSIFPKYANLDYAGGGIWFDVGLFTDPPVHWPFVRLIMIFGIASTLYAFACFFYHTFKFIRVLVIGEAKTELHLTKESTDPRHQLKSCSARSYVSDSLAARVLIWTLAIIVTLLALTTLVLPLIRLP